MNTPVPDTREVLGELIGSMLNLCRLRHPEEESRSPSLPYSDRTETIIALSQLRRGRKILTRSLPGERELWYDKADPSFALVVSYESQWKGGTLRSYCPVAYRVIESEEERLTLLAGSTVPRQRQLQFERTA